MSLLRRLYNVARGKVLSRPTDAAPDLADEPPRAPPEAAPTPEGVEVPPPEDEPTGPKRRRL